MTLLFLHIDELVAEFTKEIHYYTRGGRLMKNTIVCEQKSKNSNEKLRDKKEKKND